MNQDELKKQVGAEAVKYIQNGMIVGLGTGSTVSCLIDSLGERVRKEHLDITCVTTSKVTSKHAKEQNIKLVPLDDVDHIDLTIDGADEISADFQGIKGGGGSLLWEKIVANISDNYIWIVDESKMSNKIGEHFKLPVEVVPFGSKQLFRRFTKLGYKPTWRMDESGKHRFHTDSDNYIIDLHMGAIEHPHHLADSLIRTVGVIEQGLFLDRVNAIIVGHDSGPEYMQARP